MSKPEDGAKNTKTETKHESSHVNRIRHYFLPGGKTRMDWTIGLFTLLLTVSGVILGLISFFGYWKHQQSIAIWVAYITIVLAVTLFFLNWQKFIFDAREKAANTPTERPELVVERTRIDSLTPETPVTFRLDIKNQSKKVTARQVKILTMHALVKTDEFKGPLVYKSHPPERLFAIGPEASTGLVSASTWKITTEQITDIHARRTLLFHYGKGSYQGDDSKELTFDFCAMFEPSVGAVVACPEQYWPKNDDPDFIPRAANRAFVIVQSADLIVYEAGKKTEALITFTNSGKTPATNVRVYGHIQLRDKPLAPDMPGAKDIGEEPSQDIMPANGGSTLMPISSGLELTPALMDLIDKGTHRIYVWGIVTYEDTFGPHWTKFCMIQYQKTLKLEMCTNNNETDE